MKEFFAPSYFCLSVFRSFPQLETFDKRSRRVFSVKERKTGGI